MRRGQGNEELGMEFVDGLLWWLGLGGGGCGMAVAFVVLLIRIADSENFPKLDDYLDI
jgi:hypothetical protein